MAVSALKEEPKYSAKEVWLLHEAAGWASTNMVAGMPCETEKARETSLRRPPELEKGRGWEIYTYLYICVSIYIHIYIYIYM